MNKEQGRCQNCRFAVVRNDFLASDQPPLECRRHPPRVSILSAQRVFPTVFSHDWCGEHKTAR